LGIIKLSDDEHAKFTRGGTSLSVEGVGT
jgi:hypothetical protein